MTDQLPQNTSDNTPPTPPPVPTLLSKTEEQIYEMAFSDCQTNSQRPGLWAKALSEALGDNQKAQAIYIRLRAEQLIEEQNAQRRVINEAERSSPVYFNCPSCGKKLQLTKGELADTAASTNPNWRRSCSVCKTVFDCREVIPGQSFSLKTPLPPTVKAGHVVPPPSPKSGDAWSSGAMLGLILASIFIPLVGLILGLTNSQASPEKKQQAKTLLIISIIMMAIGFILMVSSNVIMAGAF